MAGDLRRGGTLVNILEDAIGVVRHMVLLKRIKSQSLPPRPVMFLEEEGRPLPLHRPEQGGEEPEGRYEIESHALLEMLFNEVKNKAEFAFAYSNTTLEETVEQVRCHLH
jgi:hypothetical protein